MKQFTQLFICLLALVASAQSEKSPIFPNCTTVEPDAQQTCFYNELYSILKKEFKVPQTVLKANYKGTIAILFEVTKTGAFKPIHISADYHELKAETQRVFAAITPITPATYNGTPTFKQYTMALKIPLEDQTITWRDVFKEKSNKNVSTKVAALTPLEEAAKEEFSRLEKHLKKTAVRKFTSTLNIPFSHDGYSRFDRALNVVGANTHTAAKPFLYENVSKYYNLKAIEDSLKLPARTWFERKFFNEHMLQIQDDAYWFTLDPVADLQLGKDLDADFKSTYNNTRAVYIQGGLGSKFSFSASVFESQGRFAQYYNSYIETLRAFGPDPAIVPGRGIAKRFKENAYDYPMAEGYLSYSPAKFVNIQFGHGKQFIGDGYRSLFQSDVTTPYPFLKLNTKFWKIKYTNTWTWLKDVRPEVVVDDAFLTKYIANHYLSWNATKRLNIGIFESVIWGNTNGRGFDVNYLNPIIFYRAIEFETGQGAGNAIMGLSSKFKINDNINVYGQFILDEFSLADVKARKKSWKNKFGYQLGLKYFNAFKVNNLMLQLEYNQVRPYVYSHNTIKLNYAHNNLPMAHFWGANFRELIAIGRYNYERFFGEAKAVFGLRGLDYNNTESFGGDIYKDYNTRPLNDGVKIGQGVKVHSLNANLKAGYVVNPATNLKAFVDLSYRNFEPQTDNPPFWGNETVWINFGFRTDLFNWYFDR